MDSAVSGDALRHLSTLPGTRQPPSDSPSRRSLREAKHGQGVNLGIGRVLERRRAVALAHHYRGFEDLSITQIADRLDRSPATVKAYFYDPTTPARSSGAAPAKVCLRRCGTGAPAMAGCRRHTTGRVRTRVGEGERRSHASPKESGLRRAWSHPLFGTWSAGRAVAAQRAGEMTRGPASASSSFGRESISLPKPRESTAKPRI
jgi:hypothetical protein